MAMTIFGALVLAMCAEADIMIQRNQYESTGCTGQVVKTEYFPTGECVADGVIYRTMTCNSTGVSYDYFSDAACSTSANTSSYYALDSCNDLNDKFVSCAAMTVYEVSYHNDSNCYSASKQATYTLPEGCWPTGGLDNNTVGQVVTVSMKVEITDTALIERYYNSSLNCTGSPWDEIKLWCNYVCESVSSGALAAGFWTFRSTCGALTSSTTLYSCVGAACTTSEASDGYVESQASPMSPMAWALTIFVGSLS